MASRSSAVRSLATIRSGRKSFYVLPFRALVYAPISCLAVFLVLLAIDRLVLGSLERAGWTAGELWARHNQWVEQQHRQKTTATNCQPHFWNGQPRPTDPARRTILVFGDSFVWGPPYVTLNHLWWRQLAIELERRGYHDVDVLAAGQPGWSTHRQLDCARQLIPELKPNLIIWGYVTNDSDEKRVPQISDTAERLPYGERVRRVLKQLLPNLQFKFEQLRSHKLAAQYAGPEYGYAYPDWELRLLEGDNFKQYARTVTELSDFVSELRVPTFMVTLPHFPSREYFEPRYRPVIPLWESAGIPVLDTLPEFINRYGEAPTSGPASLAWGINPADSHPGPEATHYYAQMAADYLEQHWPDRLGPKDISRGHQFAINDWLPANIHVIRSGDNVVEFDYPIQGSQLFQPPGNEPSVLLALRYPLPLATLSVEGDSVREFRVWVSFLNATDGHDDLHWEELSRDDNGKFTLLPAMPARSAAEIRVQADFRGSNRRLQLAVTPATSAAREPR
jgi:hypothetical protein